MRDQGVDESLDIPGIRAFYLLNIALGIIYILIPSTVSIVMENFNIEESLGGLQFCAFELGIIAGSIILTHLLPRFSVKRITTAGICLISASLIAASLSQVYLLFLLFYIMVGFAFGLMFSLPGTYANRFGGRRAFRIQGYLYGFLSIGYVAGPLIPDLIERLNISWRWSVALPGLFILPFIAVIMTSRFNELRDTVPLSVRSIKQVFSYDRRYLIILMACLFISYGSYVAISEWLVSFLENSSGMTASTAHLVLAIFGAAVFLGRFGSGYFSRKTNPYNIILALSIVSMTLVFLIPLPGSSTVNAALLVATGLFMPGIPALLLGGVGHFPHSLISPTYSILMISFCLGIMTIPYLVGLIMQTAGSVAGFSSISALCLLLTALLIAQMRHGEQ